MLRIREVAQLVAHYVRDVGVACSSHVFSTKMDIKRCPFLFRRLELRVFLALRHDYCFAMFESRLYQIISFVDCHFKAALRGCFFFDMCNS